MNTARLLFLEEPRFRALVPDWEDVADDAVSVLPGARPSAPGGRPTTSEPTGAG